MRTCSKYGGTKPIEEFSLCGPADRGWRRGYCKTCESQYHRERRERLGDKLKEQKRAAYRRNPEPQKRRSIERQECCAEAIKEWQRQYYKRNATKLKMRARKYARENVEKVSEQRRQKYQDNPEPAKERAREFREKHQDKVKQWNQRYYKTLSPEAKRLRLQRNAIYYKLHPEKRTERNRKWNAANCKDRTLHAAKYR
jgi:hypothetical protein